MRIMTGALIGLALLTSLPAAAQEAPKPDDSIDATVFPAAVKVTRIADGYRYVDPRGMTLYMLDAREARARMGNALAYCIAHCAELFKPLSAPAGSQPVGLWKPADTPLGRQWTYKGSPVFTNVQDSVPGSTAGDGFEDVLHPIAYIPPEPKYLAPAPASVRYLKGQWYLTDPAGRIMFTRANPTACTDSYGTGDPFIAGLTARPVGKWSAIANGDHMQWTYRRQPVFIAAEPERLPDEAGARVIIVSQK